MMKDWWLMPTCEEMREEEVTNSTPRFGGKPEPLFPLI